MRTGSARKEARPVTWPRALGVAAPAAAGPATKPAILPFDVLLADLAAQIGPELARSLGFGLAAEVVPQHDDEPLQDEGDRLPLCLLQDGASALRLELEAGLAGPLAARMFGASPGDAYSPAPGARSASWQALRRLMSEALREAFLRAGARGVLTIGMDEQAARQNEGGGHAVRLRLAEADGLLWLRPAELAPQADSEPKAASAARQPAAATSDPEWRRRAEALARQMELGVTLQIAELRLPLAAVSRMRPGDILPVRRPRQLRLMSGGTAIATLSAASLAVPRAAAPDEGEEG
jgi:flagellar motor switch/type III secretory pathway protein FliN